MRKQGDLCQSQSKLTYIAHSIVGVSNQLSWISIGIASLRFRAGISRQNLTHLLPYKNPTYPIGPILSIILNIVIVLVQGWSCFSPKFSGVDFVSYYIELPIMAGMYLFWKLVKRTRCVRLDDMDLATDRVDSSEVQNNKEKKFSEGGWIDKLRNIGMWLFL